MIARRVLLATLFLAILLGGCADDGPVAPRHGSSPEGPSASAKPDRPDQVPDQYIVVFRDDVPNPRILSGQIAAQHGLKLRHTFEHTIKGFSAVIPEPALHALRNHPWIASIEPNRIAYLDFATPPDPVPTSGLRVRLVADELGATLPDGADVAVWPNLGSDGDAAQGSSSRLPTYHAGSGGLFGGHAHVGFNEGSDNDEVLEIAGVSQHGSATLIAIFSQD
ncbi:MAG TPA: protease inhibitor I9 family protein, partial [Gemmatimonadota bacterium]|nr:protease inhibitor I9 family protein [Gemmatimonadota bacterium]